MNWDSFGEIFKSRDPSVVKTQTSRSPIMKVLSLIQLLALETIIVVVNGLGVTEPPKGAVVVNVNSNSGYKSVIHLSFYFPLFSLASIPLTIKRRFKMLSLPSRMIPLVKRFLSTQEHITAR